MKGANVAPALRSRHVKSRAINMNISWSGDLHITDKNNNEVTPGMLSGEGMNTEPH
ncbi:hypothetical protein PU683_11800 [Kosakonia cowanii]|uniref:hypothetical protein n=1 Tax=Kosakonia cowanii TaxID=208223 RepID=UPI0023F8AA1B|nr:hypothetical protein [Kosakonia cowanii]MDF7760209.1 hypothetical protein [Kosakonia cowanii]